jgi:Arc/MetJ-type ribon-helix-helix transcriptional regulator
MNITLPREQQEWLEAQVRAGAYSSVEDAVATILGQHMNLDLDDMAWARSLVDEGRGCIERCETLTLDEHLSQIDETLEKLKRR